MSFSSYGSNKKAGRGYRTAEDVAYTLCAYWIEDALAEGVTVILDHKGTRVLHLHAKSGMNPARMKCRPVQVWETVRAKIERSGSPVSTWPKVPPAGHTHSIGKVTLKLSNDLGSATLRPYGYSAGLVHACTYTTVVCGTWHFIDVDNEESRVRADGSSKRSKLLKQLLVVIVAICREENRQGLMRLPVHFSFKGIHIPNNNNVCRTTWRICH